MRICFSYIVVFFSLFASTGCGNKAGSQAPAAIEPAPSPSPVDKYSEPTEINYAHVASLTYNGYRIVRRARKVKYKDALLPFNIYHADLEKNGKTVAGFASDDEGENAVDFGLFSLLGNETKQFAISITRPRGGRHWVFDPSNGRVIFDSGKYGVGREEFTVVDIDQDGVKEISLPLTEFYMFEEMSMTETPLPEIIFGYDKKAGKYIPANDRFSDYALRGILEDIAKLDPNEEDRYLSRRLDIALRYIYAGRENDAWEFFDRYYTRQDREEIKSKIKAIVASEGTYKYIYRNRKVTSIAVESKYLIRS
jgi:hypothetical protein